MPGLSTYAFVEGGHVREGLDNIGAPWQDLHVYKLAQMAVRWTGDWWRGETLDLNQVYLYDAVSPETNGEDDDRDEQVTRWLERNGDQKDVHVRYGRLAGERPERRRQKGVDVQLAVDALSLAMNGVCDVAIIVSGDADFIPVVEALRDRGTLVAICAFKKGLSKDLARQAGRVGYMPEDPAQYQAWQLPG